MGGGGKKKKISTEIDAAVAMQCGGGGDDVEEIKKKSEKERVLPSMIKNKEKRSAVHAKEKREKRIEKRRQDRARDAAAKRAIELGQEPPLKQVPRTIENTREADETICKPDDEELRRFSLGGELKVEVGLEDVGSGDLEQFIAANDADEFNTILRQERTPKILITTCRFNSTRGPAFVQELLSVIPNAHYFKRGTYELKKIVEYAKHKDLTSMIVVHTNRREPDALLIIILPDGPIAHFKLSRLVLRTDIKNHGRPTSHKPELLLNNFTMRLGHRIGRYLFETKEEKEAAKDKSSKDKSSKVDNGKITSRDKVVARLQE